MKQLIMPSFFAIILIFLAFKEFNESKAGLPSNLEESNKKIENSIVVVELFTSQGCSSFPAEDLQLKLAKDKYPKDVFVLSYYVDYWNYIGWEDTFSKKAFTIKQWEYNRKFNNRSNYTPQLVVNGMEHFVGSKSEKLTNKIHKYLNKSSENMIRSVGSKNRDSVTFDYTIKGNLDNKVLRVVLVLEERSTEVNRGENRNRTLKNSNMVVAEKYLEISSNKGSSFIEIPKIVKCDEKILLMLLIEKNNLDVTGAKKVQIDT